MIRVFTLLFLFTLAAGQVRNTEFPVVQDLGADPPRTVNVTISGRVIDYKDRAVTVGRAGRVGLMDRARTAWRPLAEIAADGTYAIRAALVPGVYIVVAALGPYELAEQAITVAAEGAMQVALQVAREHPNAAGLLACPVANMPKQGVLPKIAAAIVGAASAPVAPKPAASADLLPSREFFYVTDRAPVRYVTTGGPQHFDDEGDPNGQLRYGTFGVQLVRKSAAGAPVPKPAPISDGAIFYKQLAGRTRGGDLLVFVHGFRVPFDDGLIRIAEFADGIGFPGPMVLFSWPSGDNLVGYANGVQQIDTTRRAFLRFLEEVRREVNPKRITLVAHSLGNRLVLIALETAPKPVTIPIDELILVAPDVSTKYFNPIAGTVVVGKFERPTLYSSSRDCALRSSAVFYANDPRVGEAGRNLVLVSGIDTVDVSTVEGNDPLGHSLYLFPSVLKDLAQLTATREPPQKRGLVPLKAPGGLTYWRFK